MPKILGVSRSGYRFFLNRKVSPTRQRKNAVKKEIQKIYDNSKQNYGAPKIGQELRKSAETISQRTVGKYMREMGIRAQWTKPWTTTTKDSDFSKELPINKAKACRNTVYHLLSIQIVAASMFQMRGVKPLKRCSKAILIVVILTIMPASNLSIP